MKKYKNNLWGAASYVCGPFSAVPILIIQRKRPFIRFHCNQSIVFFIVTLCGYLVLSLTLLGLLIAPFFLILMFVIWLLLIYKALMGEKFKLLAVTDLIVRVRKLVKSAWKRLT